MVIAGIKPSTKRIQKVGASCPNCHNPRTTVERTDKKLNLLSIPVIRTKKGVPFRVCDMCGWEEYGYGLPVPKRGEGASRTGAVATTTTTTTTTQGEESSIQCFSCGHNLPSDDFAYCPHCGKSTL